MQELKWPGTVSRCFDGTPIVMKPAVEAVGTGRLPPVMYVAAAMAALFWGCLPCLIGYL